VLVGLGGALAGRGLDLNYAIRDLPALFRHLRPVAATLAGRGTALAAFFKGLGRAASAVAPVSKVDAELFTRMADTFAAVGGDPGALQATISKSPATLDVSTTSLRAQRPFLRDTTAFGADLSRAATSLRASLPDINPALETGTRVLPRTAQLDRRLQEALFALRDLALYPSTNLALRGVDETVTALRPQLRYLGPYQTVCDYPTFFFTFLAEHLSEEDVYGFAQRALLNSGNGGYNSLNNQGSKFPSHDTDNSPPGMPGTNPRGAIENLHGQPYGAAVDTRGRADCEVGQRGYPEGRFTETTVPAGWKFVTLPHTPGSQGTTLYRGRHTGRARVPRGETFSREPQAGDRLAPRYR
jgi:hypothetical protein